MFVFNITDDDIHPIIVIAMKQIILLIICFWYGSLGVING